MIWLWLIVKLLVGIGLLAWGADRFIVASVSIAKRFGMSSLMIGVLLIGFGTSFPELVVAALAAFKGSPSLAIGNAVGSNIANIGLVVGVCALIMPLSVHSGILKREMPVLLLVTLGIGVLFFNHYLSRLDGMILVIALCVYLTWLLLILRKGDADEDPMAKEFKQEIQITMRFPVAVIWWFVGLILLLGSSELLVSAAVTMAKLLHVSDLMIGLTVVALGTSLPELAAGIVSTVRGEHDITIGNIMGSNIFNLLAVIALPALISPTKLQPSLLTRDYPIMLGFILVFWLMAFFPLKNRKIHRWEGAVLVLGYIGYLALLIVLNINR